ncbi:MAG TPA: DUF1810 domain-containing protein [Rhizomicrobium sp.]|nr:DUF1810 domain-containing protein [Rhizomicrobium sp.]
MDFDLQRFLDAQAPAIDTARAELARGRKLSHWMWFVFPQLKGLGRSATAARFGLVSLDEAKAYLAHPVLGARLVHCTALVNAVPRKSAHDIFGTPDDLKFRSCMTLFARADPDAPAFRAALERFFGGREDDATLALLRIGEPHGL